jgi:hypothetical protein
MPIDSLVQLLIQPGDSFWAQLNGGLLVECAARIGIASPFQRMPFGRGE